MNPVQVHNNYKSKHLLGQRAINRTFFLNKHHIYISGVHYASWMNSDNAQLVSVCRGRGSSLSFLLQSALFELINPFFPQRRCGQNHQILKIQMVQTLLLPPQQRKSRSCKKGRADCLPSLEQRIHTLCKILKIESDAKGYCDILDSGTLSSFTLILP